MNSLLPFCKTPRQTEIIEAIIKYGSQRKAAEALKISKGTVSGVIDAVRRCKAKSEEIGSVTAEAAYLDEADLIPPQAFISGESVLYDANGNVKQRWVKSNYAAAAQVDLVGLAFEELKKDIPQYKPKERKLGDAANDCLNLYTITDYHLGMMAWGPECGIDWNTEKAEQVFMEAIASMVHTSPDATTAVLNLQGDFMHTDMMDAVTPTNHHILDTDVRFPKLIEVAVRCIKYATEALLEKHDNVKLLIAQGNHDLVSSQWLQSLFNMYYENTPRVEVIVTPSPYYCIKHGKTMLVMHHGHRADLSKMANITASLFPKEWGETEYRYVHTGHRHHKVIREGFGLIVEQHQTLAPKDAYSAHGGYVAERGASVITYSSQNGEIRRTIYRP